MERIKEALDKVKKQQSGPLTPGRSDPSAGSVLAASSSGKGNDIDSITQPTVMLDPDHLERNRIVAHDSNNLNAVAFDLLRTRVLHKMADNGWRTIGVISAEPEAGKSVVAINLAMSIARLPERTSLLVDLDLRRPSVMKYLGLKHNRSLKDMLQETCDFRDVLVYPQMTGFMVAGSDGFLPNSAEILASSVTERFIEDVKNRYQDRIVIFDLPPLFNSDDAIAVLPKIDCVLLVVANGMSCLKDIEECLRHLPAANLVGTVLNKAQNEREAYTYAL
jgi:protein-tyrosine kinase